MLTGVICRFWDAAHYVVVSRGQMKGAYPTCIGFAGPCLVAGCNDGFVRYCVLRLRRVILLTVPAERRSYDMDGGRPLWEIKDVHRGGVTALSVSTNERFIVTGGEGGEVRVWELRTREMVSHLKEHTARVTRLAVFTDDMHVMSVSKDRALLIWDLKAYALTVFLTACFLTSDFCSVNFNDCAEREAGRGACAADRCHQLGRHVPRPDPRGLRWPGQARHLLGPPHKGADGVHPHARRGRAHSTRCMSDACVV